MTYAAISILVTYFGLLIATIGYSRKMFELGVFLFLLGYGNIILSLLLIVRDL